MIEEESSLFQIRLNEQGIKFIRKFAAISYTMLVLVIFEAGVSIFWNIRTLTRNHSILTTTSYFRFFPYVSIFFSLLTVASNLYYLRFPRILLHSIKINDEFGANKAFGMLFKSAMIFFFWLLLSSASLIWSLTMRM
jgi:hypothetical protein